MRSGIKGETMELSQGGVLVGKPKKGLQKYFHNVVPLDVGDYKGQGMLSFLKKILETKQKTQS